MKNILALCLILLLAESATAGLTFTFDQSNYEVAPNATVQVQIYLEQTDAAGDPADLTVDGLVSGGVRVLFDENPPTDRAEVLNEFDITPNVDFDDTLLGPELELLPGTSAAFVDGVDDFFSPLTGTRILLGTMRFTAGSIPGEVTTLRATDWRPGDDLIAGNLVALDSLVTDGSATITTLAAVPEPATFASSIICSWLVMSVRQRRRIREV